MRSTEEQFFTWITLLFFRLVCMFIGHKWEAIYRKHYQICARCRKVKPYKGG